MPVSSWSTTASSNATADSASGIMWSEGQAPSSINDSARAMMAEIKKHVDGNTGSVFSGAASNTSGLSTIAAARHNVGFVATTPRMIATASYEIVRLLAGTNYGYGALYLYNVTAGNVLVVQTSEMTVEPGSLMGNGNNQLTYSALTVGNSYNLVLMMRTNSVNSCNPGLMTITGACV